MYKRGEISENVRNQYIDNSGQVNSEGWLDFVRNGGLIQAEIEYVKEKARNTSGISQEWNDNLKNSDRQILEFQANYSYEKLNIDGSNMAAVLKNFTEESFGL